MKKIIKILAVALILTMFVNSIPVFAANLNEKCKITVNGQTAEWKSKPFLAYGPQGDAKLLIPMKDFFTTSGYTVTYDPKLNQSVFTADKNSEYETFYADLKTGQIVKGGQKPDKNAVNQVYLINNCLYITDYELKNTAKSFLNDLTIKIDYNYIYTPHEIYITDYSSYFPIQNNLSSLTIELSGKYPDRPYSGDQYTKYNTGEWVSGNEIKKQFNKIALDELWDGFGNLHFYTGKSEQNELTGKGTWDSKSYAVAWEMMDSIAEEINRIRKQNGLSELSIDNSICFTGIGAKDSKVNTVFDNAIHNIENNKAAHTYNGKTNAAECMASGIASYSANDKTTLAIARHTVNQWYKSTKGHKNIIMGAKYKTMGILVIITDTRAMETYAVFK
ncbi:MAG: CAP domain-containing protein [Oscillospiraceae bacterium]|nr:CAP domain-containing protein [Oscillospiraceae bacterium]